MGGESSCSLLQRLCGQFGEHIRKIRRVLISNDSIGVVLRIHFDGYFHVFDLSLGFNERAWKDICYQMKLSAKTDKH